MTGSMVAITESQDRGRSTRKRERDMKKILVIDDDEQIRHILRRFLERAGYEVLEASNGQEGMALYRKEGPELVITDIIMPKKEGMETIMDMKGEFPKAKIIAISGGGMAAPDTYLEIATRFGAQRVFSKPFELKELLNAVREMLEK